MEQLHVRTEYTNDDNVSRFKGAEWFDIAQTKCITIAGVGGIGSFLAFQLSRVRPSTIRLYDPDIIEEANMSGQLFSNTNIGSSKVKAIADFIRNYSTYYNINSFTERFTENTPLLTNILMCGFDNMAARSIAFHKWKQLVQNSRDKASYLFIDGRLAAEDFQILSFTGNNEAAIGRYEREFLFTDAEADTTICSYKQTTYMASMIASYMVNIFINYCTNLTKPIIERELPFFTEYSASNMYLKIER